MSIFSSFVSRFGPAVFQNRADARAPIAKQLADFEEHKNTLLNALQKERKADLNSEPFDADKSWDDIALIARLYFWGKSMERNALPTSERIKRLHQLAKALRRADGLTQRAMRDGIGDELYRAWFALNIEPLSIIEIDEIDKGDGSSMVTLIADDIKGMVGSLARLKELSDKAATAADVLSKTGRPTLLPRDCIQGLARVYRNSTGSKPGRGDGPFAEFAYKFMTAVGQTGFDYGSLPGAIQDAHQKFKPSWFDEEM